MTVLAHLLHNIICPVIGESCEGKVLFATFYKIQVFNGISFGDHPNHSNSALDDWSNPKEQRGAYLVSIA